LRGSHQGQHAVRANQDPRAAELPAAAPRPPSVHPSADRRAGTDLNGGIRRVAIACQRQLADQQVFEYLKPGTRGFGQTIIGDHVSPTFGFAYGRQAYRRGLTASIRPRQATIPLASSISTGFVNPKRRTPRRRRRRRRPQRAGRRVGDIHSKSLTCRDGTHSRLRPPRASA
jgi:hypothetical protein